jgi:Protein of unknown function (DUF3303)
MTLKITVDLAVTRIGVGIGAHMAITKPANGISFLSACRSSGCGHPTYSGWIRNGKVSNTFQNVGLSLAVLATPLLALAWHQVATPETFAEMNRKRLRRCRDNAHYPFSALPLQKGNGRIGKHGTLWGSLSLLFWRRLSVKYVLAWTTRSGGSAAENEKGAKRALQMYQKWSPPSGVTITEFVATLNGEGGFAVLETDDPALVIGIGARFAPYLTTQVYPVVGMDVAAKAGEEGIGFRESVG